MLDDLCHLREDRKSMGVIFFFFKDCIKSLNCYIIQCISIFSHGDLGSVELNDGIGIKNMYCSRAVVGHVCNLSTRAKEAGEMHQDAQ